MRKIKLSNSIKNVTKVSLGTVIGQVVSIITLPIIARIYSSEIIGIWTTINSYSIIMGFVCDLGLTNALMIFKFNNFFVFVCILYFIQRWF